MIVLRLALASLWNRRATAALTVAAVALSVTMALGVEKVRNDARAAFESTLSGTDLVVGARGSAINLLLYSVFRLGDATANVSWESYQAIAGHPSVKWTVPLSLGDSHQGFRVLGTTTAYFDHYRYGRRQPLKLEAGRRFGDGLEAVVGAEVAEALGYAPGSTIIVSHGLGVIQNDDHADDPFTVVGVLARTGTPVDRTVHVSLESIEAIHVGFDQPRGFARLGLAREAPTPKTITAFLVGLESRFAIFELQRFINARRGEALMAIIPGVALTELWSLMRIAETALRGVAVAVVVTGLLGMCTVIMTGLESRRREIAVLRSVGAGARHVLALMVSEALLLASAGACLGLLALNVVVLVAAPTIEARFGLALPLAWPTLSDLLLLGAVVVAGLVAGLVPAVRAYRTSLSDGLGLRL